jgi:iron complex outermembrane receptor protein
MQKIFFFLLSFCSLYAHSQSSLNGIIKDPSGAPLAYVGVLIKNQADSTILFSSQTNEQGEFSFKKIASGKYSLLVKSLGYSSYKTVVTLTENSTLQLPPINLKESAINLKDVEIAVEKPFVQIQGEKKVYNVAQNMVNTGGTAQDVLQRLPSVSVDIDGNLALRGNTSVQVWLDGKPMGSSTTVTQLLQQLPASSIDKIEMITNPSARYDAEGTGGIINIVTKNVEGKSLGGFVEGSWLVPNKANFNSGITIKRNKWAFQLGYSYRYDPRWAYNSSLRTSDFNQQPLTTEYIGIKNNVRQNHGVRLGLDYIASQTSKWSLNISLTPNRNDQNEILVTNQINDQNDTTLQYTRITNQQNNHFFSNGTLGWRKNLSDKSILSTDLQYAGSFKKETSIYNTTTPVGEIGGSPLERSIEKGNEQNIIYNLDFTTELSKKEALEYGLRNTVRLLKGTNDYNEFSFLKNDFELDSNRSSQFDYTQIIPAAYFTYRNSIKNFNYGFGLRAEYTYLVAKENFRNIQVKQNFFNLFPSLNTSYNITKDQQLTANYSLRINRPSIRQLLPIGDFSDVQNIRFGNIDLKPEIIHSLEANYSISFLKQYFSAGVYFKHILNSITYKKTFLTEQVSLNSFVNADATQNLGVELMMRNQFFKIWEITTSYNAAYITISQTENSTKIQNKGWRHTLKVLSNVTFWKGTSLQIGYDYNTPFVNLQGRYGGFMVLDAGIKKDFLNKRLTVSFNANDILNTRQFAGYASGTDFEQVQVRKRESRTYTLSLSYRFGTQERKAKKERSSTEGSGDGGMEF